MPFTISFLNPEFLWMTKSMTKRITPDYQESTLRISRVSLILFVTSAFFFACGQNEQMIFTDQERNWRIVGEDLWAFQNGELIGTASDGESYIVTEASYKDFELTLEFFPDSTVNSGVFILCSDFSVNAEVCHELNIWDRHPNQDFRTGSIVTKMKPLKKVNTLNKWNNYRIRNEGINTKVWVNDVLTADYDDSDREKGYIGLQIMGMGVIKFRNIKVRNLE